MANRVIALVEHPAAEERKPSRYGVRPGDRQPSLGLEPPPASP